MNAIVNADRAVHTTVDTSVGDSVRVRLAKGSAWSLAAALTSQGSTLLALIIAARLLGARNFGKLSAVQSTIVMLGIFAGTSLGLTASKFVAQYRNSDKCRTGRIISLISAFSIATGMVLALLLSGFASQVAAAAFRMPSLATSLRIGSALLFFHSWNTTQQGILVGLEAFQATADVNAWRGVVTLGGIYWGVAYGGINGALLALTVGAMVACALSAIAIRRQCRKQKIAISVSTAWNERRILTSFSLPAVLSASMVAPVTWIVNMLLARRADGFSEVAIFTAANQWRVALALLPCIVSQTALPILSNLLGAGDHARYRRTLSGTLLVVGALSLIASGAGAALARPILQRYGGGFEAGADAFVILQAAAVLTSIGTAIGTIIASQGRMWLSFVLNLSWAVVLIGVSLPLARASGVNGIAYAYLAAYGVLTAGQLAVLRSSVLYGSTGACRG